MKSFYQDPQDKRDYQVTITGDTVAAATASILPATGVTLGAVSIAATTARVRVSGLTLGTKYTLTLHVTGASGQEWDYSAVIQAASN